MLAVNIHPAAITGFNIVLFNLACALPVIAAAVFVWAVTGLRGARAWLEWAGQLAMVCLTGGLLLSPLLLSDYYTGNQFLTGINLLVVLFFTTQEIIRRPAYLHFLAQRNK